jgi:ribosomal protein S21
MAHNALVILTDQMPLDRALVKLKKTLSMNGTTGTLRQREHYVKPSVRKRMKSKRARVKAEKREKQMTDAHAEYEARVEARKQFGRRIYAPYSGGG